MENNKMNNQNNISYNRNNNNNNNSNRNRNKNNENINNSNLSRGEKLDIMTYVGIAAIGIVFIIIIIYLMISRFNKRKEDNRVIFTKENLNLENMNDENKYINKRDIKESEVYSTNYNLNADYQMAEPKLGDYILELKFTGYNPIKFKIFLPNVPSLGLDLEKAVKDQTLIGKKIENWDRDNKIYINQDSSEKIWSVHSRENLDLKLVPFYGALVVNTEVKHDEGNYGGGLGIVVNKNDETAELKQRNYPNDLISLSKRYKGDIINEYSKNAVIGQLFEGEETIEKIKEDIKNQVELVKKGEILEDELNNIVIEDAKFYQKN